MILLDAYALVALLVDEPAAAEVERVLYRQECGVMLFNLAEAIDVTQRVYGVQPEEARDAVEPLLADRLNLRVHSEADGWRAAQIRARHYDRKTRALSMADCFLLAGARVGDRIATSDGPIAEVAHIEAIGVIALPDRAGRRP